ncbi:metal ABC transporter permease [Azovibrio restrictus]|uniref:metal ABC transporter permease n=1 Tax=Azovibrio restrictus TaxID=146938 RepID=UPI0026F24E86|nr:metal ABC transporter permease [Azovibrio restrictus]
MAETLFDLFWRPYLAGLAMAILLPLLGLYLRLRDEGLAALAYGQVGAAGALLALMLGLPGAAGGVAASLGVALGKGRLESWLGPGALFPLLLLLGWGGSVLLTANLPVAERLGQALFEGQLYFVGTGLLGLSLLMLLLGVVFLRHQSRYLLLLHLHPASEAVRGGPGLRARLGFDLVAAAGTAVAVMSLGVMGTFALAFVTPWLAFVAGRSWRRALVWAVLPALLAYSLAFAAALYLDQPPGPLLVVSLVLVGLIARGAVTGAGHAITKAL